MTLENRMKIEGAMSKNVRSSIFQKILAKTLGGYFGAKKVDFFHSKSKNGYSPMHSSSFWVKNQNLSRSFHVYQISAHVTGNNTKLKALRGGEMISQQHFCKPIKAD